MSPGTEKRVVDADYDTATCRMVIVYNPEDTGGSRTRVDVMPWKGAHEFVVDESRAAGCDRWLIRVRVQWDADSAAEGKPGSLHVGYELEDFDCRKLLWTADRRLQPG